MGGENTAWREQGDNWPSRAVCNGMDEKRQWKLTCWNQEPFANFSSSMSQEPFGTITVVCYLFPLPVWGLSRKDLRISQLILHLHLQDKMMEWGAIGYGSFFCLVLHIWEKIQLRPLTLDKAEMFLSYVLQKHKQLFLLLLTHFSLLCPHWFSR